MFFLCIRTRYGNSFPSQFFKSHLSLILLVVNLGNIPARHFGGPGGKGSPKYPPQVPFLLVD